MAYVDWVWVPKAEDDSTVDSNYVWGKGLETAGYWINQAQGRYVKFIFMMSSAVTRRFKCTLYKEWRNGVAYYNAAFACERLNSETSYNPQIWRLEERNDGLGYCGLDNTNFTVYNTTTLVWTRQILGNPDFNNQNIPVYDSAALAFAAMADDIWKLKTKYIEGGYSTDGGGGEGSTWGGGGLFDHSSDPIDFAALPVDYATNTRLFRLYLPTESQLRDFADYLYSNNFDVSQLKKLFANPMDYILGLSVFPLSIPATSMSAHNIYIGNVDSGVNAATCTKQFIEVDCGSLVVKPFYDAYLDYAPYSQYSIYLPFCGFKDLNADEVVGQTLHVRYIVDIVTGACLAQIKIGDSVRYSFLGQCSANVPLSATDWTNSIQGAISIAGQVGTMATTGAVSASGISSVASTAVNMVKPNVQRSGGFSGSGAFMGEKTPFVVITRPLQCLPENQPNIKGFPSFTYVKLGDCEEYTEVDSWNPTGFNCSENELQEIDRLLKSGVIL